MPQANETIAAKLFANLSKRITMRQFSFSHPNMRSMMLLCRYFWGHQSVWANPAEACTSKKGDSPHFFVIGV
jgi:hypothetical protein